MKTYQFIILIIILIIFLIIFGFCMLSIYLTYVENKYCPSDKIIKRESKKLKTSKKLKEEKEEIIENFEGLSDNMIDKSIYENTMPNPNGEELKDVNRSWVGLIMDYSRPLPGDNRKVSELEKIYVNPFYPGEVSKGTAGDSSPKRNYPRPEDMVIVERDAYKFGYPEGMSMQDYVDWIYLFRKTPNLLNMEHYYNYEKLLAGVPIHYKEGKTPPPAKRLTPLNAEDYFMDMYTKDPTQPIPQLTKRINEEVRVASNQGTSGILPSNYVDYGDFKQNFGVKGSTGYLYNPGLADKTDANFLQYFVGPNWLIKEPKKERYT